MCFEEHLESFFSLDDCVGLRIGNLALYDMTLIQEESKNDSSSQKSEKDSVTTMWSDYEH